MRYKIHQSVPGIHQELAKRGVVIAERTVTNLLAQFRKVTKSYWPGLFHCYDHADLPRTNNDLEQYFGSARYHERSATGRKTASPAIVVRGAVRIVASVATQFYHFCGADLQPTEIERWYILRDELEARQHARRAQFRFRRDPSIYLADLENKLLQLRQLPNATSEADHGPGNPGHFTRILPYLAHIAYPYGKHACGAHGKTHDKLFSQG